MGIQGQGHFLTLAQGRVHTKFKLDFLRNYCADLNQILYESFQVQGNEKSDDMKQWIIQKLLQPVT